MIKNLPNFSHPIKIYVTTSTCIHMVIVMPIFKYFNHITIGVKPDDHEDEGLLEPTGPLSEYVRMKAIELANVKVANETPHNNRTGPYLMLIPAQKYKVVCRTWHDSFYSRGLHDWHHL